VTSNEDDMLPLPSNLLIFLSDLITDLARTGGPDELQPHGLLRHGQGPNIGRRLRPLHGRSVKGTVSRVTASQVEGGNDSSIDWFDSFWIIGAKLIVYITYLFLVIS
jgi:hypothetical protein